MNTLMFKIVPVFIGLVIALMIGSVIFRGVLVSRNFKEGVPTYEIRVPSYDGGYNSYITTNYREVNGCIEFKDEFGFDQRICDNYTVTNWK